jgi:hypothetical protein
MAAATPLLTLRGTLSNTDSSRLTLTFTSTPAEGAMILFPSQVRTCPER